MWVACVERVLIKPRNDTEGKDKNPVEHFDGPPLYSAWCKGCVLAE